MTDLLNKVNSISNNETNFIKAKDLGINVIYEILDAEKTLTKFGIAISITTSNGKLFLPKNYNMLTREEVFKLVGKKIMYKGVEPAGRYKRNVFEFIESDDSSSLSPEGDDEDEVESIEEDEVTRLKEEGESRNLSPIDEAIEY